MHGENMKLKSYIF